MMLLFSLACLTIGGCMVSYGFKKHYVPPKEEQPPMTIRSGIPKGCTEPVVMGEIVDEYEEVSIDGWLSYSERYRNRLNDVS